MLEIACLVDPGARSPENDDRAAVNGKLVSQGSYTETAESACLVVICDGVGGEACGNEAADIVTEYFSRLDGTPLTVDNIKEYVANVNKEVRNAQKKDFRHSKMSTTIAGLYINGINFIAFNIGDTRIYRYRSCISQISKDHSLRQEQIDLGLVPVSVPENVITRYIGGSRAFPEIVDGTGRVFENDAFLLCTDGVWGVLDADDFEEILSKGKKTEETCEDLVKLALQKESSDNLSVILVRSI